MAAVQPLFCSGRAAAACFGRSAAVANVRAMVKQGGSETAENDGSKLVNVAHPRCQRSLPGRGCYPACRRRNPDPLARSIKPGKLIISKIEISKLGGMSGVLGRLCLMGGRD
jgi:hypothetical protein